MRTVRSSTGAPPVCAPPTNKDHPPESVLELPERTLVYLKSFARGFGREEQGCGLRPIETNRPRREAPAIPRPACYDCLKGAHMAEMIPDRLPHRASAGEKKVFALLQQLPDDVIVYYEPVVADRYPDFIVVIPTVGLLIVEVRGWYPNYIEGANNAEVTIHSRGRREVCKHPIRQASDYQHRLMDVARGHPETAVLLQHEGAHTGRFVFPFGHLAILNNCSRQQLDERGLSQVFPAHRVLARDELEALSQVEIIDRLKGCFDPWWDFGRLTERQISVVRAVVHPEIVISPPVQAGAREQPSLKVLDLRQERNAHSIGEGHRIIYGVAGSGKTVILVARARLVAGDPQKRVLILCYNRALAEYFQQLFAQIANVTCLNFHQWGSQRNGVFFDRHEDEEDFG